MTTNLTTKIALIEASWHKDIVEQCYVGMAEVLAENNYDLDLIDRYEVPGSLEIPLTSKKLARNREVFTNHCNWVCCRRWYLSP